MFRGKSLCWVVGLACLLAVMFLISRAEAQSVGTDLLKENINRIVWITWHSGGKSFETQGTLKGVNPRFVKVEIKAKYPEEEIKFEGKRMIFISLSAVDALEIRLPK